MLFPPPAIEGCSDDARATACVADDVCVVALAATTVATAAATRIAATTTQRLVNVLRISSASLRPRRRTCRIVIDVPSASSRS